MDIEKVYDCGGECLGDEYINIAGLQGDTKKAIVQLIYLDETVDILNDAAGRPITK